MRTTVTLDPEQLRKAEEMTSTSSRSELVRMALDALIERESAIRLARLGGTEPTAGPVKRRKSSTT